MKSDQGLKFILTLALAFSNQRTVVAVATKEAAIANRSLTFCALFVTGETRAKRLCTPIDAFFEASKRAGE